MTIFRESKGWDYELAIFNSWYPLLTMSFKYPTCTDYGPKKERPMLSGGKPLRSDVLLHLT